MSVYNSILKQNEEFINKTWEEIINKINTVFPRTHNKLPSTTINGVYDDLKDVPDSWTNGFWPGILWLLYVGTNDKKYMDEAIYCEQLMKKSFENFDDLFHDVGFLWHISTGIHYRLLGDKKAKSHNMYMASTLSSRFNMNTKSIRAFQPEEFSKMVIIDTMMNLPLLYWASKEANDPRFSLIAKCHADTAMQNHIRPDGSAYHILEYDLNTGELLGPVFGQGAGVDTAWSRGQAWAIYGFVLSYIHTGKQEYLDTAKKAAHYFISSVCQNDYVPLYDFRQSYDCDEIDTSASAIAACGCIELAKVLPENEKALYINAAINMLRALVEKHCDWSGDTDAILQNVAISPKVQNTPAIFGEYFFIEAFYKLKGFEPLFW